MITHDKDPVIGLLSPCGWGNLGDAAIQDAVIAAIRSRWPNAKIVGFTSNPRDTQERHGVPAYPLSGYAPPTYGIGDRMLPRTAGPIDQALQRLQGIPLLRSVARPLRLLCDFLQSEPLHWALALRWLRQLDLLIVSGGGQLDDFWGRAWGHPYVLWKWSFLAQRTHTPVVMLSVGLGTLRTRLARVFVRGALSRMTYRSYRDERTRTEVARLLGQAHDGPVAPDLAFGLEPVRCRPLRLNAGVVGISPMAYCDPRVWPVKDGAVYQRYVEQLARFVVRLTDTGRRVVLFSTDTCDRLVMDDVWAAAGCPVLARRANTTTLPALFGELAQLDVVLASRLHGVILAHLAECPVVALSYDWKVAQHMAEMGQTEYCVEIDAFDVPALAVVLERLEDRSDAVRATLRQRLGDYRSRVQRQFEETLQ